MSWFEFIICQGFQLSPHLKIMNFKHRYVKVCRILCWKPLLLSRQDSTRGLQQVCKWYQADKKPHQVFRLLHKEEVLLPSKLTDKACVTSASGQSETNNVLALQYVLKRPCETLKLGNVYEHSEPQETSRGKRSLSNPPPPILSSVPAMDLGLESLRKVK
ncbi:hypothetical protein GBF38_007437, partial [Nibea albiflora]